jgi:peptidoglycan/LPS O-acetylase OafA/YrhL
MTPPNAKFSPHSPRLAHIDGLRAVAALLVLVTHTWVFTGAPALSFSLGTTRVVLAALPAVGYVGVNLFLVLSGFCLAWPFVIEPAYRGRMTAATFWIRRIRRICPAYFVSIAVVVLMYPLFGLVLRYIPRHVLTAFPSALTTPPGLGEIWPHMLFLHNLSVRHVSTINGSYWSLALEFQLYLLFPLFLELLLRWPWRTLFVVAVAQLAYRCWLWLALDAGTLAIYDFVLAKAAFGRMLDFYAGMVAALIVARHPASPPWRRFGMPGLAAFFLLAAFLTSTCVSSSSPIADVLWAFGFAALVCHSCQSGSLCQRALSRRPFVATGVASYSIYLLHQPLVERADFLIRLFLKPGWAFIAGVAVIPLVLAAGFVFFALVEGPSLRYLSRVPARSKAEPLTQLVPAAAGAA